MVEEGARERFKRDLLDAAGEHCRVIQAAHRARGFTGWGSGESALRRGFIEGVLWILTDITCNEGQYPEDLWREVAEEVVADLDTRK